MVKHSQLECFFSSKKTLWLLISYGKVKCFVVSCFFLCFFSKKTLWLLISYGKGKCFLTLKHFSFLKENPKDNKKHFTFLFPRENKTQRITKNTLSNINTLSLSFFFPTPFVALKIPPVGGLSSS